MASRPLALRSPMLAFAMLRSRRTSCPLCAAAPAQSGAIIAGLMGRLGDRTPARAIRYQQLRNVRDDQGHRVPRSRDGVRANQGSARGGGQDRPQGWSNVGEPIGSFDLSFSSRLNPITLRQAVDRSQPRRDTPNAFTQRVVASGQVLTGLPGLYHCGTRPSKSEESR
jgi:hypothetical protein